jgi:hypothetical protein
MGCGWHERRNGSDDQTRLNLPQATYAQIQASKDATLELTNDQVREVTGYVKAERAMIIDFTKEGHEISFPIVLALASPISFA